jgi:hypothetical protein
MEGAIFTFALPQLIPEAFKIAGLRLAESRSGNPHLYAVPQRQDLRMLPLIERKAALKNCCGGSARESFTWIM